MKIRPIFAWYDAWIGVFIDRPGRRIFVFPVPMFGIVLDFGYSADHGESMEGPEEGQAAKKER